ncbi:MAG: CHAT domain-containing protein [Nostoc sp. SerVER01]
MEPFLKSKFPKRLISKLLLALVGLSLAFSIHIFFRERAIAIQTPATQVCTTKPNPSPEYLSKQGRDWYEQGRPDVAIDCWQRATAAYRQAGNETESINNRINIAQAEQALGLYPRACNTLVQIYGEKDCTNLLQLKDQDKRQQLFEIFNQQVDSPAKITALRSLGNILRGLGELNLSNQVLLISLNRQSPEKPANWLDIGNTRRALSNKEQDLYSRSLDSQHLICAIVDGFAAKSAYQQAIEDTSSNSDSISAIKLQAQLNQLSLLLDLKDWHSNKINKQNNQDNAIDLLFAKYRVLRLPEQKCWNEQLTTWDEQLKSQPDQKINYILTQNNFQSLKQQLSNQTLPIQLQEFDNIQQQINTIPLSHAALYTRLNFVQSWMRLNKDSKDDNKIKDFLTETLNQAKKQDNVIAESYALGYLGKLYEDSKKLQLAISTTQDALFLAQSIPATDIVYQWQWQLGRIYKSQLPPRTQVQTKELENDTNILNEARVAYEGTFKTLESLRRELATINPDAQISFQKDIEGIYREYVDLLLRDSNPQREDLSKARAVISSLQAAELENFLRQACPEYNLSEIDSIIDNQTTQRTAFISPILLDDRIEVIIKLPNNLNNKNVKNEELEHYSKDISRVRVEEEIRQFQRDLEEEYTFEAVTTEGNDVYKWLLQGAEKYLENNKIDTLVFALDTTLQGIPLAALVYNITPENKPQYLIEKYAIAIAPRLEIPDPTILKDRKINILAAGLDKPEEKVNEERNFTTLKYVGEELKELDKIQKNNSRVSVTKLENKKFNTNELQSNINFSAFQILHLATHGEFSSSPENTFILAFDKMIRVNEVDKVLKKQAQNQQEPIELIVLSACETASGDQRATLGISGVAVRAGARSAIASLWALDDKNSVDFTEYFYKYLINNPNETKAQALQQAQIALMKNIPGREHPRYWAPYILLGNWL